MKHEEYIALALLFVLGLFLWTTPIRTNPMPFGEGDAAWHFGQTDAISQFDQTYWRVQPYIGMWYYDWNSVLGLNALEYPPAWHINGALFQVVGGERIIPIYVYIAIASFLGAFTVYFLMRKLYGIEIALFSACGVLLSFRWIMVYLWGQRPTLTTFILTPMILYALYKYLTGFYQDKPKAIYIYLIALLAAGQFLLHILGLMQSVLIIVSCIILFWIKYKKLPLSKNMGKHIFIALLIFGFITAPFYIVYLGGHSGALQEGITHPERMLYWYNLDKLDGYPNIGGPPAIYYDNLKNYFVGYFIFVILGIIYILYKREDKDLLMLGWLVGTYLALHTDVVGLMPFYRTTRYLLAETLLFYPLIGIGIFSFINLIKSQTVKGIIKGIAIALLIVVILFNFNLAKGTLEAAYNSPTLRITEDQYQTVSWIAENIPPNSQVYYIGQLTYPKQRFMYVLSKSYGIWQKESLQKGWLKPEYVVVDFSDIVLMKDNMWGIVLTNWEENLIEKNQIAYTSERTGKREEYHFNRTVTLIHEGNWARIYRINWEDENEI